MCLNRAQEHRHGFNKGREIKDHSWNGILGYLFFFFASQSNYHLCLAPASDAMTIRPSPLFKNAIFGLLPQRRL